jgi:hypothetical protein
MVVHNRVALIVCTDKIVNFIRNLVIIRRATLLHFPDGKLNSRLIKESASLLKFSSFWPLPFECYA